MTIQLNFISCLISLFVLDFSCLTPFCALCKMSFELDWSLTPATVCPYANNRPQVTFELDGTVKFYCTFVKTVHQRSLSYTFCSGGSKPCLCPCAVHELKPVSDCAHFCLIGSSAAIFFTLGYVHPDLATYHDLQ